MRRTLCTMLTAVIATGCAGALSPNYDVRLSAGTITAPKPAGFAFAPPNWQAASDPKVQTRAISIVRDALKRAGLVEHPVASDADIVVSVLYEMSQPRVRREIQSEPLWRTVTGPSTREQTVVGSKPDGTPIYGSVTVPGTPTQQYMGERQVCAMDSTFEKTVWIIGRTSKPSRDTGAPIDVWGVRVSTRDRGRDAAHYMAPLTAAAAKYIDRSSEGDLELTVGSDGRVVKQNDAAHANTKSPGTPGQPRPGDPC